MNRARDRYTSVVMLHLTKTSKASMKDGNTSSENVSALRASRSRLTIPEHS
jgi:hypothetical protein